jgi:hypothetical protein
MVPNVTSNFIFIMAICLFILGVLSIVAGVFILIYKVMGEDLRVIANQTAKLAQKGIVDDVAGLVGNASTLVVALNQLVKTATGVGFFLNILGILLMAAAYYLIKQGQ